MRISKPVLREYPYRIGRGPAVAMAILIPSGTLVIGFFALHAREGANLRGIGLSPDQFRLMLGVVGLLSLFSWFLMGQIVVDSFVGSRRVAITRDSLILPRPSRSGMSKDEVELPFERIQAVGIAPFIGKTRIIRIVHDDGVIAIPGNMLRRDDFYEVGERLRGVSARDGGDHRR